MGENVIVAMSGGVDSSVAAMLLAGRGFAVHGLFMRTGVHSLEGSRRVCCSLEDASDARKVASMLGIDFHVLDFGRDFEKLIADFLAEYRRGRTPNPCIVCNDVLKFGRLLRYAHALGAAFVATGHYARIEERGGRVHLVRGLDRSKDQSYVLFALSQDQLARALFPVGGIAKDEVRRLAVQRGLPVGAKSESQDICFVPGGDYRRLLRESGAPLSQGKIVDAGGSVLGEHEGIELFTIGQRRGLGRAFGRPMYVIEIRPGTGEVVIGPQEELYGRRLRTGVVNWVSKAPTSLPFRAQVQIRYAHRAADAMVEVDRSERAIVTFDEPQRAITPGQAAVFYEGEYVAGGAWIEKAGE